MQDNKACRTVKTYLTNMFTRTEYVFPLVNNKILSIYRLISSCIFSIWFTERLLQILQNVREVGDRWREWNLVIW